MHDINPLGTTMHLRELDRRAKLQLRPVAALRSKTSSVMLYAKLAAAFSGMLALWP